MSTTPNTPKPKLSKKTKIVGIIAAPLLLFTGCVGGVGIGSSSDGDTAAASEPAPTETVTASPEPAPTVTETPEPVTETVTETPEPEVVTEEVEVEVAPQACLDALDAGDTSIELLRQGLDYSAQAMDASARMDIDGINAAAAEIEALTPELEDAGFDWGFFSEACKDASNE